MIEGDRVRHYVCYTLHPTKMVGSGVAGADYDPDERDGEHRAYITSEQYEQIEDSDEPTRIMAEILGLPYQKRIANPRPVNLVELVAEDRAFTQACRFGSLVEDHAVYCHNDWWVDAPRKCRRTWWSGGERRDEDCPGYESNPRVR